MNKQILYTTIFAFLSIGLIGCASSLTGDTYTRDEVRKPQVVRMGVVESLRPVKIEGTKSNIGSAAGTVVGGVAGSKVGGGKGSIVAAVIGAVAGGMTGAAIEEGITRTQGVEITVREDNGALRAYVQQMREGEIFRIGDRVRILTVNGNARVTR
ncbi:MAG: glycine zipper 2TM domain-containing protein [Gammaproteobacteria bacterium]|nr:glycine zipper 2TM domain-containing protein [Gammaproteobacteria bacterium]NNJ90579.1 glycine zipper 2TM domain-containing protein [Gammaproteobacteria bacterium]